MRKAKDNAIVYIAYRQHLLLGKKKLLMQEIKHFRKLILHFFVNQLFFF